MKVWVGGVFGDRETPLVVARTLQRAMTRTIWANRVPRTIEDEGYTEQWTCAFIDGDETMMRCTTTIESKSGDEPARLYVEEYELDEADVESHEDDEDEG
jgi:hypothetical protein